MKKILALLLACPSLLFAAPASDTNIVAGFRFSARSNYNLLIPVSSTNGTINWTNVLLGVSIINGTFSNGTFHGNGGGLTNLPAATNHVIIVGANFTNSTGGVTTYYITNVAGGGGDTLWGTNATSAQGGITNRASGTYEDVWISLGNLAIGGTEGAPIINLIAADGSATFANGLLSITGGGSLNGSTNYFFDGFDGAFVLGENLPYATNFGQINVDRTNKVFEIDATNYMVRFQNNRWAFTNGVAHGDGTGISNIVGQVYMYTNASPAADGVFPVTSNRAAIAYKMDGTDISYTWNPVTFIWQ